MNPIEKLIKRAMHLSIFALLISMSNPLLVPTFESTSRLQPYLAEIAAESPDEMIRVIAIKSDGTDLAEKFAEKLGAVIYVDLPIINGFAMAIEGKMLDLFASHASVQWVSYDAPMTFSGESAPANAKSGSEQDWLCDMFRIGCQDDEAPVNPTSSPLPTQSTTIPTSTSTPTDPPAGDDCWWNTSFTQRRKITFNNSASGTDLNNFPVLVKFNSSNINYNGTQNRGQDIRFVDGGSCTRLLAYEIEKWNEYGDSFVWVNVPKIEAGSTSDYIWVYYGNTSAADAQNKAGVWSETYAAVYHMNGNMNDSSGNNKNGGLVGTSPPTATTGKVAGALQFGNYGWANTPVTGSYGCDPFSFEVYWKASGFGQKKYIISNSMAEDKFVGIGVDGVSHFLVANPTDRGTVADTEDVWVPTSTLSTNRWYYTAFQKEVSDALCNSSFKGYLDGQPMGSEPITGYFNLHSEFFIGHRDGFGNEYNFYGAIDEVRISNRNVLRSPDYYEAQNLSMTNAFLSVGAKETYDGSQPTPTPTTSPTPTPTPASTTTPDGTIPSVNSYLQSIFAPANSQSQVVVAVIDSGVQYDNDFKGDAWQPDRIVAHISGVPGEEGLYMSPNNDQCADWQMGSCWYVTDQYGHGSHVAGIIAGNGTDSSGLFKGIVPKAKLINFRVADQNGMAHESGVVEALQFILELKETYGYNIRVVNMSMNSTVEASYNESPLNAALELLWFQGIVVVVSAGNSGGLSYNTALSAPANDPYIITVGAVDEHGTGTRSDDTIPTWSAHGVTVDGVVKPDVYAPGRHIISVLSSKSPWATQYPERLYSNGQYFRVSGTSMAAPMVAGAIAHFLYLNPSVTPDQVKYLLMHDPQAQISSNGQRGGYLNMGEMGDESSDWGYANQDNIPHILLRKMVVVVIGAVADMECGDPISACDLSSINWNSINWDSINWDSMNWDSIDWDYINWDSMNWDSMNWDSMNWNSINWNSMNWNSINWNSINWNSINWNSINWSSMNWNSLNWNSMNWNSINWDSMNWNSINWNSTFWGD